MILLLLLVFSALQTRSSGQYVTEIDDCIQNGVNVGPDSVISERSLMGKTCGFLMQANEYIVVQPNKVNLSEDARIRLYLVMSNGSMFKQQIYEYYTRFLFRNPVFVGTGNQQFALVVLSKNNSRDVGQFEFVFRTNCSVDMAAEDFPTFTSPNYVPENQALSSTLNNNFQGSQTCSYNIYSRNKNPFSVRFTSYQLYYWMNVQINSTSVTGPSRFVFKGDQSVPVYFNTQNYYGYGMKSWFSAKVSTIVQSVKLQPLDNRNNSGIAQISYQGATFSLEYGSMSIIDLQVFCINLNYGGLESIRPYENITGLSLISYDFQCVGAEKILSQCRPLLRDKISFSNYYYRKPMASVVTCKENFPVRLVDGSNSSGVVQVRIGNTWTVACSDNMDGKVGDVFCREMGYGGALETVSYTNNNYYYYYYYNSPYYQSTGMSNIRCGDRKNLRDCTYELSTAFRDNRTKMYEYERDLYSYSDHKSTSYINSNIAYYTYCNNGAIKVTCKQNQGYILAPGHHQGYLQYNDNLVCLNNFNMKNAAVYCRYLGYPGIRKVYQNSSFDTTWYSQINLQCRGHENSPAECPIGSVSECQYGQTMGVICQDLALKGSMNRNEGQVVVYYKGQSGLFCDSYLNINTGNVICRQLGFSYVSNFSSGFNYNYGSGYGVVLLTNLQCNGYESSIHDCPWKYYNDGYNYCYGNGLSNVVCQGQDGMCGVNSVPETYGVNSDGYKTNFGAHPWQARLIPYNENEWCSATIINNYWLLTSANCFGLRTSNFYITVGSSEYNVNSSNWVSTHSIDRVIQHPEYSTVTGDYNIALVKTTTPLSFSAYVQPVCRGSGSVFLFNQQCWTTGWNHRESAYRGPLMGKVVKVMPNDFCRSLTQFDGSQMSRYLCSENSMNKSAIFNGESGGPLVCKINGTNTIVGVVARSVFGARATSIRLYSRVDSYAEWIDNMIARF